MIILQKYIKSKDGGTAIEFAILAPIFFVMLIGMLEIGLNTLTQSNLDEMSYKFTLGIGMTEDQGMAKQDVINTLICNDSHPFVDCDKLDVGIDAYGRWNNMSGIITQNFTSSWRTGCGGMMIVTELNYPVSSIILPFSLGDIIERRGTKYHRARGMLIREPGILGNGQVTSGTGSGSSC